MAVPVVIDGYNLLYARGAAPSAASRSRLVHDLVRWAGLRQRRAVVVFDAWAQGERVEREEAHGPVTVCFTRYGERADDRIVRWVSARPEAVVVTSDRAVRQAARRRGAAVLDSDTFAARLDAALDSRGGLGRPPRCPPAGGAGEARARSGAPAVDDRATRGAGDADKPLEDGAEPDDERDPATPPGRHAGREAAWLRGL